MLIYVLRWQPSWISDPHKKQKLGKDIPMIIHLQFGFSQFISFREEDLWNFSLSEHIVGRGSHVDYPTQTKNRKFVEDHPIGILVSEKKLEMWRFTDDGSQVMAIVSMDLWSRWTNEKHKKNTILCLPHTRYKSPWWPYDLIYMLYIIANTNSGHNLNNTI
jgi:hypothetical protein